MYLEFTAEQQNTAEPTPGVLREVGRRRRSLRSPRARRIRITSVAWGRTDGWGSGGPPEYGGQGSGALDQMILVEESHWAGVPLPLLTLNSVGPRSWRSAPRAEAGFLPASCGVRSTSRSVTPSRRRAPTWLRCKTRAVRDGDEYVINGEKLYSSAIQYADYVWLAARTDPDAAEHKGLSVFIVPVDAPGFSWTPLATMAGDITSSTFYEDVRVPVDNLVGDENSGWTLITNQLNLERVAICPVSGILRSITEVRGWAQAPD